MEEEGLKLLAQGQEGDWARDHHGGDELTETCPLVAEYADIMQVGARNMQNFALLKTWARCQRPVDAETRPEFDI